MLEYFAAPTGPPPPEPAQVAGIGGPVTAATPPGSGETDDAMFAAPAGAADAGPWARYGPATRPVAKRTTVSGTPPWEPAAPPEGVLPWPDPRQQMITGQVVGSGPEAGEPESADPGSRPRRRPDWRRAVVSGTEPAGSVEPEPVDPAFRASPPPAAHAASPGVGQPVGDRPDLAAPAAWWGVAAGASADWDPEARPSGQARHADTVPLSPAHAAAPGQHRSGLPIRQPRSISQAPRSASGSLWEPAAGSSSPSGSGEPLPDPGSPRTRVDDDRPIFVWEPSGVAADTEPGRSAD